MSDSSHARVDVKRVIADALEDARDNPLDPATLASVRQLLLTSAEARRCYLEFNQLNHLLTSHDMPSASIEWDRRPTDAAAASARVGSEHRRRFVARRKQIVAAAVLVATMVLAVYVVIVSRQDGQSLGTSPRVIASLEQFNGNVSVTTAGAETTSVSQVVGIRSGDTVRTRGAFSSAVIAFADGTRLSLVGSSSLTASDDGRKSIVFHGGTMFGSVVAQPPGRPMLVVTPQDKMHVLGTRFGLDATAMETELHVDEGRVRLTRLYDGKSVDVSAGRRVVSNATSDLVAEPIAKTPDAWSEDFENGLPDDWEIGKFVAARLPSGSQGAVRAERDVSTPNGTFAIATQAQWTRGLFAVHDDTHLHFTLAMQDPGWFNILILTRTDDGDPPTFAGNYIFDRPVWFGEPGQWGSVTIPLSLFRSLPPARDAFQNALPFQVLFSSPDKDRSLMIDRMWTARGGPGTVESKVLEETKDAE